MDERDENQCDKPPEGWECTREAGHEGPCAAVEIEEELHSFTTGELYQLAGEIGGAATRPLLEDNPDYVFPAERCFDAIKELLKINGYPPYPEVSDAS